MNLLQMPYGQEQKLASAACLAYILDTGHKISFLVSRKCTLGWNMGSISATDVTIPLNYIKCIRIIDHGRLHGFELDKKMGLSEIKNVF